MAETDSKPQVDRAAYLREYQQANKARLAEYAREYRAKNREKLAAAKRQYASDNVEHCRAKRREWREANRDKHNAGNRDSYYRNYERSLEKAAAMRVKFKEERRLDGIAWRQKNKPKLVFYTQTRLARQIRATPPWCDVDAVLAIYLEAGRMRQESGILYEVDHAVPLRNKMVCGLHVPANLQIITRAENRSKSNKFTTDWK